jgi:hypothetical protein
METVDLLDWDTVEHCVEPVKFSHKMAEFKMDNIQLPSSPPPLVRSKTVFISTNSLEEKSQDDGEIYTLDMLSTPPALTRQNCNEDYIRQHATDEEEPLIMDMAPNIYRQNAVSQRLPSPTEARVKYSDEICYNK